MISRRITISSIFGILCIALLLTSGSAKVVCHKEGNCPDAKACYGYCVGLGFKDYGGLCTRNGQNLCCCVSDDAPGHGGHGGPGSP